MEEGERTPGRQTEEEPADPCELPINQGRVVIEGVSPQVDSGRYPAKRVVGEEMVVEADIFSDGHDLVDALLLYRKKGGLWQETPMRQRADDRWQGSFPLAEPGTYFYTITGWVDHFRTWQRVLKKKHEAGQDVTVELGIGVRLLREAAREAREEAAGRLNDYARGLEAETDRSRAVTLGLDPELARLVNATPEKPFITLLKQEFPVVVERKRALFSSWYELFPRSWSSTAGRHGTLKDVERRIPELAELGFDVLYLPPIHPIGTSFRKGRNNAPQAEPGDPGSPWAIGGPAGGHRAIHPELGSMDDFHDLMREATRHGIEIALDIAFQCSPDHPYLKAHPEWFLWRPDGTVQYAENPPKKYEDIVPFHFECAQWRALWEELKGVIFFWMEQGVRIFRVDNPHTKPFPFWEWLICEAKSACPDAIFLAEAFTRPKVMYRLAKLGFSQSYTYFTWRTTKKELTDYVSELVLSEVREYLRPNFWPNTPDILPEALQYGRRPIFMIRLALAATLSSCYGIYGPVFELCVGEAVAGTEEYRHAEKYEIRSWDWDAPGNIKGYLAKVNRVRRENRALQRTDNVVFLESDNDQVIFFAKKAPEPDATLLVAVNLDPFHRQSARLRIPIQEFDLNPGLPFAVQDLLSEEQFLWQGEWARVDLEPGTTPARIFRARPRLRREVDFDYYL